MTETFPILPAWLVQRSAHIAAQALEVVAAALLTARPNTPEFQEAISDEAEATADIENIHDGWREMFYAEIVNICAEAQLGTVTL